MERMNYFYLGLPIVGYLGYKGCRYVEAEFYSYVLGRVKDELDKRMQKEDEEDMFSVGEKSATIRVISGGKRYVIFVPYDRSKSSSMLRKKVFLLKGNSKVDISQKPGIPYLVSANQLGGESISVENLSGEVISTFTEFEIPGFI
jgi:hypothetical protein